MNKQPSQDARDGEIFNSVQALLADIKGEQKADTDFNQKREEMAKLFEKHDKERLQMAHVDNLTP